MAGVTTVPDPIPFDPEAWLEGYAVAGACRPLYRDAYTGFRDGLHSDKAGFKAIIRADFHAYLTPDLQSSLLLSWHYVTLGKWTSSSRRRRRGVRRPSPSRAPSMPKRRPSDAGQAPPVCDAGPAQAQA